nr:MAG TPA: hypothetical protein [Caudoviricetes sp.]
MLVHRHEMLSKIIGVKRIIFHLFVFHIPI